MASRRGCGRPPSVPWVSRGDQSPFLGEAGSSGSSEPLMVGEAREPVGRLAPSAVRVASGLRSGGVEQVSLSPDPVPISVVPPVDLQSVSGIGRSEERMRLFVGFCQMQPPVFCGEPDPAVAEGWIGRMKVLLDLAVIPEDFRVALAVSFLRGEALSWWLSASSRPRPSIQWWPGFEKAFYAQFLGEAKRQEFVSLIQGRRSVAQYETQFWELSRFASDLVASEEERIRRFVDGLRPTIRSRLGVLPAGDFLAVSERVRQAEREWVDASQIRGRAGSRVRDRGSRSLVGGPSMQFLPAPVATSERVSSRPARSRRCYGCRQRGHDQAHCPLSGGSSQPPQRSPQRQLQFPTSEVLGTSAQRGASGPSVPVPDQSRDRGKAPML